MSEVVEERELTPLVKLGDYKVVRNNQDCYTFQIEPRVMEEKDSTKVCWWVDGTRHLLARAPARRGQSGVLSTRQAGDVNWT